MRPAQIENLPDVALLAVYKGKTSHLIPTERVIAVPQQILPLTDDAGWALEES